MTVVRTLRRAWAGYSGDLQWPRYASVSRSSKGRRWWCGSALGCIFSARAGASDYWSRMIIMLRGMSHGTGGNAMGRGTRKGQTRSQRLVILVLSE